MPTENRSSNTEMVRVPLEPTREMLAAALEVDGIIPRWRAMVAAAPTQQHQSEPVELPERKPEIGQDPFSNKGWNACLDEIAKLGPLYTHPAPADPGEVERLRKKSEHLTAANRLLMDDCDSLRAQLAERDALPPVAGDLLPPVGSKVLIHLAREDEWVEHTVVGYYAWENLRPDPSVHRVFVRVRDAYGYLNARGLGDIRPVGLERQP